MRFRTIFLCLAVLAVTAYGATRDWPLKRTPDLSSGFGDWRPRRFHTGIDIRTGGRIGAELYSPVDGYVYRLRASYEGYGKALYVMGDDDLIYVYGHLNSFNDKIDRVLKHQQVASQRYYVDLTLPPDSIRIKKGELLGKTGKTGTGAPHLHFETRTSGNTPLNPLTTGFELQDKVPPSFSRIGFQLTGPRDLYPDGTRKKFVRVTPGKPGRYTVETPLIFDRPFGILVDCYDQMRTGGMRQSIYDMELRVDGKPYYRIVLDSLDFETGIMSDLEFDNQEVAEQRKRVRRLYAKPGNRFVDSRSLMPDGAIIGGENFRAGNHTVEIIGEDAFGNKSTAEFEFLWRPDRTIMTIDSVGREDDTTLLITAVPTPLFDSLKVEKVILELDDRNGWREWDNYRSGEGPNGRLEFRAVKSQPHRAVFRLAYITESGAVTADPPASGIITYSTAKFAVTHEVIEDGLLVTLNTRQNRGFQPHIDLYYQGERLGTEWPQRYYGGRTHYFLVPAEAKYRHIDNILGFTHPDTVPIDIAWDSVNIWLAGDDALDLVKADSSMTVAFEKDHFYAPRFLEFMVSSEGASRGDTNAYRYTLLPEVFLTRKDFDVMLKIRSINQINDKSGLCWYDETDNKWIWLADSRWDPETKTVTASARGGGSYTAILDMEPPIIYDLNLQHQQTYFNLTPTIIFSIIDNLSGIEDDRSIDIRLDGTWMIPEYDPESKQCKTTPLEPLAEGNHHLGITVTDRAGNTAEHYIQFSVKKPAGSK